MIHVVRWKLGQYLSAWAAVALHCCYEEEKRIPPVDGGKGVVSDGFTAYV